MIALNSRDLTQVEGGFVTEASDLQISGRWPLIISVDGIDYTFQNVARDREGDVTQANYRSARNRKLIVFND